MVTAFRGLIGVQSNGQGHACSVVKRSRTQNNGQNYLNLVIAVTIHMVPMGVTTLDVRPVARSFRRGLHECLICMYAKVCTTRGV